MSYRNVNNAKVLVLGGTGFIGSYLTAELLKNNFPVRLFCRIPYKIKSQHSLLDVVEGDFISGVGLEEALNNVDVVFHLISTTIPSTSNQDITADIENNLVSTIRLLELMNKKNVKRIIFISSGGTVYGKPQNLPVCEQHSLNPLCSYGIVKVAIEKYLNLFAELYDFDVTILRLSNPFGSSQLNIGVLGSIATFFYNIYHQKKITIWGDGSTVRDYIYIKDAIAAMIRVLIQGNTGIFNIGSGNGHSLNQIIELISNITGNSPIIEYLPSRPFDVSKIYLNINKAIKEINWLPTYTLESGCKEFWDELNK